MAEVGTFVEVYYKNGEICVSYEQVSFQGRIVIPGGISPDNRSILQCSN
jgi:hypothetical protein